MISGPEINADLTEHIVVHSNDLEWQQTEHAGVFKKCFELIADPSKARETSLLRFEADAAMPGSQLDERTEMMVLEGELSDGRLASTDRLVREWAGPMPAVDWPALSTRISNAVREEAGRAGQTRRTRWSWFVKASAPLATAAVIALAATWWITTGPKLPIDGGSSGASLVMVVLEMPVAVGKVSISFDLSPVGAPDRPDAESGGRAIAYGPKINDTLDSDADAFFY